MEYKRLTNQKWDKDIDLKQELGYSYIYQRLYELEDKIENGTLIELPCKRHTMVYVIICCNERRRKYDILKMAFTYDMIESYQCNWFLTREEAEARIKELQGKE